MRKLKPWSLATGVARNRKPQPWAQTRVARIKAAPVQSRTRANQSRGPLQQESHASPSRTRTNTYTRNPKAVVPFNRSRTHHQAVEARKAIAFNFLKVEGRCGVVTTRNYLFKNYVFLNSNNYVNFILARICMQV
jgi:hypothetical protein